MASSYPFGDVLLGVAPLFALDFVITRDDDWHDPLPQFLIGGAPFDLSGMSLEMWVRPTFDFLGNPMLHLTNAEGGDGVVFDVPTESLMTINVSRGTVISSLPAGTWRHFAVLNDPSGAHGWTTRELFRGTLTVLPGRV